VLDDPSPIEALHIPAAFRRPLAAIAAAARELSAAIAAGGLGEALGARLGLNSDGDAQARLDVLADDAFRAALASTGVRWYASEERDTVTALDAGGALAIAIDPLDGSSNIDVNVAIGTIFGFYPAEDDPDQSFLRPGRDLRAAGYVIYGPQTALVASFGNGVVKFVLDRPTGVFRLADPAVTVPACSTEYAINASNYRHWHHPVRAYVDDCIAGAEGPHACDFNTRWIASLVAEVHRIVTRGGVFLYPADRRPGYEHGRLRRVYECAPIAFLIEQAGGKATDGADRLLDQRAESLHERTPFVFGSAEKVDRIAAYHDLPEAEASALFGKRGLFRESRR
jgi:fructose-1,6-bisphosphatase I